MKSLTLSTVPKWLEHSSLATSLRKGKTDQVETEDDPFEVPLEYYMSDDEVQSVATLEQLVHMLQTMHYWGEYDRVPWAVLDAVREKRLPLDGLYETKWPHVPEMATVINALKTINLFGMSLNCSKAFAVIGGVNGLRYAHENGCPWDEQTCAYAAENGHLGCLRYAHENGCPWNEETCVRAAENGHLECLQYAHEHGCPWNARTCKAAACNGHYECLRYAHEHGCPWDKRSREYAAKCGAVWSVCDTLLNTDVLIRPNVLPFFRRNQLKDFHE